MYGLWTCRSSGRSGFSRLAFSQTSMPVDARLGQQFRVAADGLHVAGLFADPDRQRRAPVALARKGPIDVRFQEIAEPPVADVLRQPVDPAVVGQHLLLEGRGADEPALARILDQRVFFGPPAERIVVDVLLLVEQHALGLQLADDVAVAVLDPAALVLGRFGGERAVGGDGADQRRALAVDEPGLLGLEHVEVHLAERRGLVDDARAGVDGDEIGRHDPPCQMCCRAAGCLQSAPGRSPCVVVVDSRTAAGSAGRCSFSPEQRRLDGELACRPSRPTVSTSAEARISFRWLALDARRPSIPGRASPRRTGCSAASRAWWSRPAGRRRARCPAAPGPLPAAESARRPAETARTRSGRPLRGSLGRLRR